MLFRSDKTLREHLIYIASKEKDKLRSYKIWAQVYTYNLSFYDEIDFSRQPFSNEGGLFDISNSELIYYLDKCSRLPKGKTPEPKKPSKSDEAFHRFQEANERGFDRRTRREREAAGSSHLRDPFNEVILRGLRQAEQRIMVEQHALHPAAVSNPYLTVPFYPRISVGPAEVAPPQDTWDVTSMWDIDISN